METKTLLIQIPEGFEIDKDKSTFECIVFKETPKKPVRISKWEDFGKIKGYYITSASGLEAATSNLASNLWNYRNVWPTKELAEASLALCQLMRYRDNWNEGWVANYTNDNNVKWSINLQNGILGVYGWSETQHILAFETKDMAVEFGRTFNTLLEIAKPLL